MEYFTKLSQHDTLKLLKYNNSKECYFTAFSVIDIDISEYATIYSLAYNTEELDVYQLIDILKKLHILCYITIGIDKF